MKVLVASASKHGSTEGIAGPSPNGSASSDDALAIRAADVADSTASRRGVGSAVYTGSWMKEATEFAETNAEIRRAFRCGLEQRSVGDRGGGR
jgi:hypothetical protein